MTYEELTRKLRKLGFEIYRRGKGGHELWWHPETKAHTIISHHSRREIAKGTLGIVLRDLGLTVKDLEGQ